MVFGLVEGGDVEGVLAEFLVDRIDSLIEVSEVLGWVFEEAGGVVSG